jgi:hypothetical protein
MSCFKCKAARSRSHAVCRLHLMSTYKLCSSPHPLLILLAAITLHVEQAHR